MLHLTNRAIMARLTMWNTFFETGHDGTPDGATDEEYGLDQLVDIANESNNPELCALAGVVQRMEGAYLTADDARGIHAGSTPAVTWEEIEAVLTAR